MILDWDIFRVLPKFAAPEATLRKAATSTSPKTIDALVKDNVPEVNANTFYRTVDSHQHAINLSAWASPSHIRKFLKSRARVKSLVRSLMTSSSKLQELIPDGPPTVWIAPCAGCNAIIDVVPHTNDEEHMGRRKRERLLVTSTSRKDALFQLHRVVKLLTFTCSLLAYEVEKIGDGCVDVGPSVLASLLVPEGKLRCHDGHSEQDTGLLPLMQLVGLIKDCSVPFPKVAQCAATLLSLLVCRRPAAVFSQIDPETLIKALDVYLNACVFKLVEHGCTWETNAALVNLNNILPLLYFLSDWGEARRVLPIYRLSEALIEILLNLVIICPEIPRNNSTGFQEFNEIQWNQMLILCMIKTPGAKGSLWARDPIAFSVCAIIEVLGRWAHKNISIDMFNMPQFENVFSRLCCTPTVYGSVVPIATALNHGTRPFMPSTKGSLLKHPLTKMSMRCSLESCDRTEAAGGKKLLRCSGACGGLARYCCEEHHKEHWERHKFFCKRQIEQKYQET